jgi:hypothetical protein
MSIANSPYMYIANVNKYMTISAQCNLILKNVIIKYYHKTYVLKHIDFHIQVNFTWRLVVTRGYNRCRR